MWERKSLKKEARGLQKRHYWRIVLICLAMAYVTGAYAASGTTSLLVSYNETKEDQDTVQSNLHQGSKSNAEVVEYIAQKAKPEENKKYYRGVFASIFNNATEYGSVLFGILDTFFEGIWKGGAAAYIVVFVGTLLQMLFWFFVQDVLAVCQNRYFCEAASYKKVSMNRMLYIMKVKRWWNCAKIMFFKWVYTLFWMLTIAGGFIKHYSYLMIPYILAENPSVTRKEAFCLSREMMRGNKWRTFVLDLSFLGWTLLSAITGGLVGIFYTNGYYTATFTELYLHLREQAIQEKKPGYQCLNDKYIGLQPAVPEGMSELPEEYPGRLFSIPEHGRRGWIKLDYERKYSIYSLILLFFTFSVVGWVWEVSLHLSTEGFVNRGVLHGPWLPIYGSGGVLILVLLQKVRKHPMCTFALTVVICAIVEYFTAWYLETTKGLKWWDYSGYLLNLDGRICAEGLLVFGLGGCAFIYILAPIFDEWFKKIPKKLIIPLCSVLLVLFCADQIYSHDHPNQGKGITDYDSACVQIPESKRKIESRG